MSYDLFGQAFRGGDGVADPRITDDILEVLRPFMVSPPDDGGFVHTRTPDGGTADFYLGSDGHFMVNRFSSGDTMGLIFRVAHRAHLVILGPGLPAILTRAGQLAQLPDSLAHGHPLPVLVTNAEELDRLIADDGGTYESCRARLLSGS